MRYILQMSSMEYEEAENLLQNVFIKVYQNINEYQEQWSFSSWIYRITHNAIIDHFRANKSENGNISLDDEEYAYIVAALTDGLSPDQELLRSDARECVKKSIATLPQDYREAIILRYFEDRSYQEMSDILKIPIGTASTLVNRAKKRLLESLEKLHCIS